MNKVYEDALNSIFSDYLEKITTENFNIDFIKDGGVEFVIQNLQMNTKVSFI